MRANELQTSNMGVNLINVIAIWQWRPLKDVLSDDAFVHLVLRHIQ